MFILRKIKSLILKPTKRQVVLAVVVLSLVSFGFLAMAAPALAKSEGVSKTEQYIAIALGWIIYILIIWPVGKLISIIFAALQSVFYYNHFVDVPGVEVGWEVVRDISNMFFVVVLLFIAIATILRIESYNYKRLLPKLLIMAILINFSKHICGFIIDAFQFLMFTFVKQFGDAAGGNLADGLGIQELLNINEDYTGEGISFYQLIGAFVLAAIMLIVTLVVVIVMLIILAFRVAILWLLIVLSPLAYLLAAFPRGEGYAKQWWDMFIKYVTIGPLLAFFLWLSLYIMQTGLRDNNLYKPSPPQEFTAASFTVGSDTGVNEQELAVLSEATTPSNVLAYIVAISLLVGGMALASSIGGFAGGVAGAAVGRLKAGAKLPLRGAWGFTKWGTKRADDLQAIGQQAIGKSIIGQSAFGRALGLDRLATHGVALRSIPEAWRQRATRKERQRLGESVGVAQDIMSRAIPLVRDKTDETTLARAAAVAEKKREYDAGSTEQTVLVNRLKTEVLDKTGRVKHGKEVEAQALLEILTRNHDLNEAIKDEGIANMAVFNQGNYDNQWASVDEDGNYIPGKDGKMVYNQHNPKVLIRGMFGKAQEGMVASKLQQIGLDNKDALLWGMASTDKDGVVRLNSDEDQAYITNKYIEKRDPRLNAQKISRQDIFNEYSDQNGMLHFQGMDNANLRNLTSTSPLWEGQPTHINPETKLALLNNLNVALGKLDTLKASGKKADISNAEQVERSLASIVARDKGDEINKIDDKRGYLNQYVDDTITNDEEKQAEWASIEYNRQNPDRQLIGTNAKGEKLKGDDFHNDYIEKGKALLRGIAPDGSTITPPVPGPGQAPAPGTTPAPAPAGPTPAPRMADEEKFSRTDEAYNKYGEAFFTSKEFDPEQYYSKEEYQRRRDMTPIYGITGVEMASKDQYKKQATLRLDLTNEDVRSKLGIKKGSEGVYYDQKNKELAAERIGEIYNDILTTEAVTAQEYKNRVLDAWGEKDGKDYHGDAHQEEMAWYEAYEYMRASKVNSDTTARIRQRAYEQAGGKDKFDKSDEAEQNKALGRTAGYITQTEEVKKDRQEELVKGLKQADTIRITQKGITGSEVEEHERAHSKVDKLTEKNINDIIVTMSKSQRKAAEADIISKNPSLAIQKTDNAETRLLKQGRINNEILAEMIGVGQGPYRATDKTRKTLEGMGIKPKLAEVKEEKVRRTGPVAVAARALGFKGIKAGQDIANAMKKAGEVVAKAGEDFKEPFSEAAKESASGLSQAFKELSNIPIKNITGNLGIEQADKDYQISKASRIEAEKQAGISILQAKRKDLRTEQQDLLKQSKQRASEGKVKESHQLAKTARQKEVDIKEIDKDIKKRQKFVDKKKKQETKTAQVYVKEVNKELKQKLATSGVAKETLDQILFAKHTPEEINKLINKVPPDELIAAAPEVIEIEGEKLQEELEKKHKGEAFDTSEIVSSLTKIEDVLSTIQTVLDKLPPNKINTQAFLKLADAIKELKEHRINEGGRLDPGSSVSLIRNVDANLRKLYKKEGESSSQAPRVPKVIPPEEK